MSRSVGVGGGGFASVWALGGGVIEGCLRGLRHASQGVELSRLVRIVSSVPILPNRTSGERASAQPPHDHQGKGAPQYSLNRRRCDVPVLPLLPYWPAVILVTKDSLLQYYHRCGARRRHVNSRI